MGLRSGMLAQLGIKTETTVGTAVTVDRFLPLRSESMKREVARIEDDGIIPGARVMRSAQWEPGAQKIAGDVNLTLYDNGVGLWLEHAFGGKATTGSGPYVHTFTPGDLTGKSFTMQLGKPQQNGTVQPFTYAGCKIPSWSLSAQAGGKVEFTASVVAMTEVVTTPTLATASLPSNLTMLTFVGGSVTVGGSAVNVKQVTLEGDNGLDVERMFLGSATIAEAYETALRAYTGSLQLEFVDLTQYNRFINATEAAVVVTFAAGANSLVLTYNARFDGETPVVAGPKVLELPLAFKAVGASTDAGALTAVLTNDDATA